MSDIAIHPALKLALAIMVAEDSGWPTYGWSMQRGDRTGTSDMPNCDIYISRTKAEKRDE